MYTIGSYAIPQMKSVYEVLRFLLEDENVQKYIDAQSAVPIAFKKPSEMTNDVAGALAFDRRE